MDSSSVSEASQHIMPGFAQSREASMGSGRAFTMVGGPVLTLLSLAMFAIFGSLFDAPGLMGLYWPVSLIASDVVMPFQRVFQS